MDSNTLLKLAVVIILLIVAVLFAVGRGMVGALDIALGIGIALLGRAALNYLGLGV